MRKFFKYVFTLYYSSLLGDNEGVILARSTYFSMWYTLTKHLTQLILGLQTCKEITCKIKSFIINVIIIILTSSYLDYQMYTMCLFLGAHLL